MESIKEDSLVNHFRVNLYGKNENDKETASYYFMTSLNFYFSILVGDCPNRLGSELGLLLIGKHNFVI